VTVSARPANDLPAAATVARVDLREGTAVRAGTLPYAGEDLVTGWHAHDLHQIEYAFRGVVEVETRAAHYLLPPQQAVFIPAGLAHQTTLRHVESISVFLDPGLVPGVDDRARVLAAAPVLREMIVHAARWPITRTASDPLADAYFEVLAQLACEWLDDEVPLSLPTSDDPLLAAVMAYTDAHLDTVTAAEVCGAVGLSERTLRRQFPAVTGLTWRAYRSQSRVLRAMTLLAEPGPTVLDVATQVGFDSVSAFTRAFARTVGETPTGYRHRVLSAPDPFRSAARAR